MKSTSTTKSLGITVFMLQVVAMVTMLCDHIAGPFFDNWVVLRCIGRFAFPIYAFLLAEGFRHMKDKPQKIELHLGGLVVLALVSEFCYDLLESDSFAVADLLDSQSALITLTLGFLGLMAIEKWKNKPLWMWSTIALTALCNFMIHSNYKFAGVLLVYAFYFYLKKMEKMNYFAKLGVLLAIFICYLPIYHWARYDFCDWTTFADKLVGNNMWWYISHAGIAVLLAGYKGQLGFYSKPFKKVYRWFYPAHLLILGLIRWIFLV